MGRNPNSLMDIKHGGLWDRTADLGLPIWERPQIREYGLFSYECAAYGTDFYSSITSSQFAEQQVVGWPQLFLSMEFFIASSTAFRCMLIRSLCNLDSCATIWGRMLTQVNPGLIDTRYINVGGSQNNDMSWYVVMCLVINGTLAITYPGLILSTNILNMVNLNPPQNKLPPSYILLQPVALAVASQRPYLGCSILAPSEH